MRMDLVSVCIVLVCVSVRCLFVFRRAHPPSKIPKRTDRRAVQNRKKKQQAGQPAAQAPAAAMMEVVEDGEGEGEEEDDEVDFLSGQKTVARGMAATLALLRNTGAWCVGWWCVCGVWHGGGWCSVCPPAFVCTWQDGMDGRCLPPHKTDKVLSDDSFPLSPPPGKNHDHHITVIPAHPPGEPSHTTNPLPTHKYTTTTTPVIPAPPPGELSTKEQMVGRDKDKKALYDVGAMSKVGTRMHASFDIFIHDMWGP